MVDETKAFLDTSYFLELINLISPNVTENFLQNAISSQINLYYSSITVFELQALAAKRIAKNELDIIDALRGIQSLVNSKQLNRIDFFSSLSVQLAMELREFHIDFIDCVILASSIIYSDFLISEDASLQELIKNKGVKQLLDRYSNGDFKILSSSEVNL